jgi:hypothetical protein
MRGSTALSDDGGAFRGLTEAIRVAGLAQRRNCH